MFFSSRGFGTRTLIGLASSTAVEEDAGGNEISLNKLLVRRYSPGRQAFPSNNSSFFFYDILAFFADATSIQGECYEIGKYSLFSGVIVIYIARTCIMLSNHGHPAHSVSVLILHPT